MKIELSAQINELKTEVLKEPKHFDDDDLLVKRNQSDQLQKKIDIIWNKISEMMKMNIDEFAVQEVQEKYSELAQLKNEYFESIQIEYTQR